MVKHHEKKKKLKNSKKKQKELNTEDLDRFAGSSEEESEHEIEPTVAKRKIDVPVENEKKKIKNEMKQDEKEDKDQDQDQDISSDDDEEISSDSSTSDSQSEEEPIAKDEGMANVMSRILYNQKKTLTKTPILSKTTTPLQKKLIETKKEENRIKARRKQQRKEHLSFLHIPQINNPDEIQQEREYRRIATRGVVALFNAISKHQEKIVGGGEVKEVVTKEKFLDMLKQTALEGDADAEVKEEKVVEEKEEEYQPKKGWKALQDDYLMGSTIKDWDKELSDDGSDRGAIEMDDF